MTIKSLSCYTLYFLGVSILFALLFFPDQRVSKRLSENLSRVLTHITIHSGQVRLKPPLGLALKGSEIACFDNIRVRPEILNIRASMSSALKSKKDLYFELALGNGTINGHLNQVSFSEASYSGLAMDLSQIAVKEFIYRANGQKIEISFDADGQYEYDNTLMTSKGKMYLSRLTATLPPIPQFKGLGLSKIDFTRMEIDFTSDKNEIRILKCLAKGPVFDLEINGELTINETGPLNLKGYIRPVQSMISKFSGVANVSPLFKASQDNKGLPFNISGTMLNPILRFQ